MPVHEISDPKRLFASLSLEAERSALLTAFLHTFGPGDRAWTWRAGGATNISFVVYLTHTSYSPILFSYGPDTGIENLLQDAVPHLPDRLLLHVPADHRGAIEREFRHELRPDAIFSLAPQDLREPKRLAKVSELGPGDAREIEDLMSDYPGTFFRPDQLAGGLHLGLRQGGRLVAFGSAPIVAPEYKRAFVSNIVTRTADRRKGYAKALNYALASRLFAQGIELIGLGVFADNAPGQALVKSLGCVPQYRVLFGSGVLHGTRAARAAGGAD